VELNRVVLLGHYNNSKFNKPNDFFWTNMSGGSLNWFLANRRFTQSIRKLGLRKIRLYDLRHGHITELLNDGVPDKQIQERVGHSSATMTKDRYGHFLVGAQEKSIRSGSVRGLQNPLPSNLEPAIGFEPTTRGLRNRCSTTELRWHIFYFSISRFITY
jgi:hypothetical protein